MRVIKFDKMFKCTAIKVIVYIYNIRRQEHIPNYAELIEFKINIMYVFLSIYI